MKTVEINEDLYTQSWTASVQLRWIERVEQIGKGTCKLEKVLQQKHVSNLGNVEWRDIPLISE